MPAIKNLTAEYYIPEIVDDEWQLSSDEIVLDVILGEGAFGVVHKGYMKIKNSQDTEVAIKMLKGTNYYFFLYSNKTKYLKFELQNSMITMNTQQFILI